MKKLFKSIKLFSLISILVGLLSSSMITKPAEALGTAKFTLSPPSGTFEVGSTVSFNVNVQLSNSYNVAWADIYYDSAKFKYLDTTIGSAFNGERSITAKSNSSGPYIEIKGSRNSGGNLTGQHTLATLRFKMKTSGGTYLNFGSKTALLYPTTQYTTSSTNGNYSIASPPSPPPPAPTPTPTPSPTPSPTPAPAPSPKPSPRTQTPVKAPTQSPVAKSGLQISEFNITDVSFASAILSWKTNIEATTKVNFSTDKNDLSSEKKDDTKTTDHQIILTDSDLRAGKDYYIRITSDDGSGPVTIDGEFGTRFIPVIVKVTDTADRELSDVTVTIDGETGITADNGETEFELSDGDVTIFVSKGDIDKELQATVEVPDEDADPQTITLALGESDTVDVTNSASKNGGLSIFRIVGIFMVIIAAAGAAYFFIIRRRIGKPGKSAGDILEAENYVQPIAPPVLPALPHNSKPEPASNSPVHHESIAELVKQKTEASKRPSSTHPAPVSSAINLSPTGQEIPRHTSLKEMVQLPESDKPKEDLPLKDDLPTSPEPAKQHHSTKKPDPQNEIIIEH